MLSFELKKLQKDAVVEQWLYKAQYPINLVMWLLITFQAATQQFRNPGWLPHLSLIAKLAIILFILVIMLDGMYRIWNLGSRMNEAFPNQRMFYILIGTFFAYFIGQTMLVGETLFVHITEGDVYTTD